LIRLRDAVELGEQGEVLMREGDQVSLSGSDGPTIAEGEGQVEGFAMSLFKCCRDLP
jgi:hypothetical protein